MRRCPEAPSGTHRAGVDESCPAPDTGRVRTPFQAGCRFAMTRQNCLEMLLSTVQPLLNGSERAPVQAVAEPEIGDIGAPGPLVRFTQRRGLAEGVEWHACGSWQMVGGWWPVTPGKQASADTPDTSLRHAVGSDLLDFGQVIIAGMRSTTGEGEPDDGAQFDKGRKKFSMAGQTLGSAAADDRWDSAAARAYADQNTRQQVRTETMADADQAVFSVLVREAVQIKLRRDTLDDQSDILAKTSHASLPLQFIPRYGEAARLALESTALSGALLTSAQALQDLHSDVSANAAELSQAVGRYAGVADGAGPTPTGLAAPMPDSVHPQETEFGEGVHVGG